jgi:predicted nucleic acid-binding protein
MSVFIDTSGLLAVLDADDRHHGEADAAWQEILLSGENLVTTSYVIVETFALAQHRLGMQAVKVLHGDIFPVMAVEWVTEATHRAAVEMLITASRKRLSLVDCVSFAVMRRAGLRGAFTFDRHFREQGFDVVPRKEKSWT